MPGPTGNLMRGPGPQLPPGAVEENIGVHGLNFENRLANLDIHQQRRLASDPLGKTKPGSALEGILDPTDPTDPTNQANNENQSPKPKQVRKQPNMRRGPPPTMGSLNTSGSPQNSQPQSGLLQGVTNLFTRLGGGKKRTKKGKKAKKNKSRKPNKLALRRSTRKHAKRHPKKNAKRQTKKH